MCGIALIAGGSEDHRNELRHMLAQMQHRGELTGVHYAPGLAAGVRRLPIVDRQHNHQPRISSERVLVFNGEIYNYQALRRELAGRDFQGDGDTEVLLRAFETHGPDCVHALDGQFAFVIAGREQLFFARDPLGIKPLYYVTCADSTLAPIFYFASEIKALTFLGRPIRSVPPGHRGTADLQSGRVTTRAWFQAKPGKQQSDEAAAVDEVRTLLDQAVRKRVATDLPVGVVYSGGIDSSIVLHHARKHHDNVTAFTVVSDHPRRPGADLAFARRYCEEHGVRHVIVNLRAQDLSAAAVRAAVHSGELSEYGDVINALISLPLFRAVRDAGIKIALTGDGSDELFAGYDMYARATNGKTSAARLSAHKLANLHRTELQRVDRCAMAAGVEARTPFLDAALIRFAADLPDDLKLRPSADGVAEKYILRAAFADELPEYILRRRKNALSYSSGLHEIGRYYKPAFAKLHRARRYELHEPLHRDFSRALRLADGDVDRAAAEITAGRTESMYYLYRERLAAWLRLRF